MSVTDWLLVVSALGNVLQGLWIPYLNAKYRLVDETLTEVKKETHRVESETHP